MDPDVGSSIKKYFKSCVETKLSTRLNLSSIYVEKLFENGLQIFNSRDQACGNGVNVVGQRKGVQARILSNTNPAPFSCHAMFVISIWYYAVSKRLNKRIIFF